MKILLDKTSEIIYYVHIDSKLTNLKENLK